jgi:hypothetical protein
MWCLLLSPCLAFLLAAGDARLSDDHDHDHDPARKKLEKLASEAVVKFYEAFEGRDLDALLIAVETPWFHDGKTVLSTKEDVRNEFKVLLAKRRDVKQRKVADVKAVFDYGAVRQRTDPADRRLLDQVVKEDDQLVLVVLKPEPGKPGTTENVVVLVKIREGVAKVVGVKN